MSAKLTVTMMSNLDNMQLNKDIIPAIVILKYKNILFAFNYKKYSYSILPSKSSACVLLHCCTFNIESYTIINKQDKIISDKSLLNAFKKQKIRLSKIVLINAKTGQKVQNIKDFKLRIDCEIGVELALNDKEYKIIKLNKNFSFC